MYIIDELVTMLSYEFIQRAFIVGLLVAICSALLGVTLVLKRYSMIGDGLGHSTFGIISAVAFLNTLPFFKDHLPLDPFVTSMIVVIIIAIFLLRMSENSKINSDSAIAVVSITFLTLGILVVSFSNGLNTDIHSILFGSILAVSDFDLVITIMLSMIVILLFGYFYNKIFSITFDESFARATGVKVDFYNTLLAILTAITVVLGMQLIGTLLISSLLVVPALTSIRLFKSFKMVIISSVIVSVISFVIGMFLSYLIDLPTGGAVVAMNLIFYLIAIIVELIINRKS